MNFFKRRSTQIDMGKDQSQVGANPANKALVTNGATEPTKEADQRLAMRAKLVQLGVHKVSEGTAQVQAATLQLVSVMETINQQMGNQRQAIGRAAGIIAELGAFSQEVTASVADVGQSSDQTATALIQGKEAVKRSVDYIGQIQQTVERNSVSVRELVDQTMLIDRFVSTIKEIADQTNLLALNASIEAARAGEQGRGFSVVANEVKSLAETSANSASEIGRLLGTIKKDAQSTIHTLEQSVNTVNQGCQLITSTGESLDTIMTAVTETISLVQEISQAINQQAANNEQLVNVTEEMSQVLDKAALYIETAAFDADQQQAAVSTLVKNTQDLAQLEQALQESIGENIQSVQAAEQVYRVVLPQDPITFDPAYSGDSNSNYIIYEVFAGLLRTDLDGKPVPDIAASWHLEDDGCTYSFHLRQDAYFHHGRQVEAQDVKYTLERLVQPRANTPSSGLMQGVLGVEDFSAGRAKEVVGIKVHGRFRLSITLSSPNLTFLISLANQGTALVPREIVEERGEDFARRPVGAGPFVFQEWVPGERVVLTANQRFHGGRPLLDRVNYRICKGPGEQMRLFLEGEADHLRLDGTSYRQIANHPIYGQLSEELQPVDLQYCGFNCRRPPFDNKLVRKAVCHAFDRETYLRETLSGQAVLSQGPLPPHFLGGKSEWYDYSLSKAKELMRQAGYGQGYPGEVIMHVRENNQEQASRAEAIRKALVAIGIQVKLVILPWSELLRNDTMERCNLYLLGCTGGHAEGKRYLEPWFHSHGIGQNNFCGFRNDQFDQLIDKADLTASPEKRRQLYLKANEIIVDEAPWLCCFHPIYYLSRQPSVKGLRANAGGTVGMRDIWLD